ncbi:HD domain-containing protein, partial [Candidatus Aerophobetes bacterium]|nr:HD domain-containing protein [Candidatus Aerophobetes bacterium]
GNDQKRIEHARKVMRFAEKLLEKEEGDWHIVIPTSILHDVGIKEAEKKYGEAAPSYQEKEGPSVAKEFLLKMSLKREDVEEICEIIAHHHSPGKINTQNFKLVYDADCLVNLKDEINKQGKNKLERKIEEIFLTDTGKNLARKLYLKDK